MKKVFLLTISFGILSGLFISDAFAISRRDNEPNALPPTSIVQQSRNDEQLNDAIYQHQKRYYNRKSRTLGEKNIYYRMTKAAQERRAAHVKSSVDDALSREGDLTNWDSNNIRNFQQASFYRPNSKAVFRRCIVNYYFEGGDCSAEELKEGVIYSSTHRVDRVPNAFWTRDIEVINALRNIQRKMDSPEKVGAGQQRQRAIHKGSSSRSYVSPYTKTFFTPEDAE
jgi:hypothetical protein